MAVAGASAPAQFSADYQTNVISGVVSNWAGDYIVGSNTVFDLLRVEESGLLSNAAGFIGYEGTATDNFAIVAGSGSVWSNADTLTVGRFSAGSVLTVSNGGRVVAHTLRIAAEAGSTGRVFIHDGYLATVLNIWFGPRGNGAMCLSNSTVFAGGGVLVGDLAGSRGELWAGGAAPEPYGLSEGRSPPPTAPPRSAFSVPVK